MPCWAGASRGNEPEHPPNAGRRAGSGTRRMRHHGGPAAGRAPPGGPLGTVQPQHVRLQPDGGQGRAAPGRAGLQAHDHGTDQVRGAQLLRKPGQPAHHPEPGASGTHSRWRPGPGALLRQYGLRRGRHLRRRQPCGNGILRGRLRPDPGALGLGGEPLLRDAAAGALHAARYRRRAGGTATSCGGGHWTAAITPRCWISSRPGPIS